MIRAMERLPLLLILLGIAALAMLVPAIHAWQVRDMAVARAFTYSAALLAVLVVLLALAMWRPNPRRRDVRAQLLALVGALTVMPLLLAVPFAQGAGDVRLATAWFEMVSAITTTGASAFDGGAADRLADSLHLWRGLVGWLGGLMIWIAAAAILAPLNLGGFEVVATGEADTPGPGATPGRVGAEDRASRYVDAPDPVARLARVTVRLLPIYMGLTLLLWIALTLAGEDPFDGAMTAFATLSTSGIRAATADPQGILPEAIVLVFLVFALSRLTYSEAGFGPGALRRLREDRELRLALVIVIAVPTILFLRQWWGATLERDADDLPAAGRALWGALFTTVSFLTTTGFTSDAFDEARLWSGLQTPGLVLMGLALVGGGVATTAGGVKLLRIYALFQHGRRELDKLTLPSSIGGAGSGARRLRREGAYVAWIFFMLFAMSVALVMAAMTLAGQEFQPATVLTIAALSTTGPLAGAAADAPILYANLGDPARAILALAMVLGRLETLALIALANREFWRG